MGAAEITAWCTGIAAIIAALAGLAKILTTRPRIPVAEEVLLRIGELEDVVLLAASYIHTVRVQAAAHGHVIADPPERLLLLLGDPDAPPGHRRRTDRLEMPVPPRTAGEGEGNG